jgi:hypothetical protein
LVQGVSFILGHLSRSDGLGARSYPPWIVAADFSFRKHSVGAGGTSLQELRKYPEEFERLFLRNCKTNRHGLLGFEDLSGWFRPLIESS